MSVLNSEDIGKRIRDIRLGLSASKKVSLEAFGQLIIPPASKGLVQTWEKGNSLPQKERLEQIAQIGNVSIAYLLYGKEINGYGERIRKIREEKFCVSPEIFGRLFDPIVSPERVEAWENENALPNWQEIMRISSLTNLSHKAILFGMEEPLLEHHTRILNPDIEFEKTQDALRNANLDKSGYFNSDFIFLETNRLRLAQLSDPDNVNDYTDYLGATTFLFGLGDEPLTSNLFETIEDEIDDSIDRINRILEKRKAMLLDKYKTN